MLRIFSNGQNPVNADWNKFTPTKAVKYNQSGDAAISNLAKVSTPGRRSYVHSDKIPVIRSGTGSCILSTNKGMMTGHEAKKQNLGGEIICTVW